MTQSRALPAGRLGALDTAPYLWTRVLSPLLFASGCHLLALLPPPARQAPCPAVLVSTEEIQGNFLLRQRIRIRDSTVDVGFDLIVQKRDSRLTVVGLTPLGGKAFTITQEGTATEVRSFLGPGLRVPPENVLGDLHRVRFRRIRDNAVANGTIRRQDRDAEIIETWSDGSLERRIFVDRASGTEHAVVEFGRSRDRSGEARALIRNRACGYEATIVTVSEQILP